MPKVTAAPDGGPVDFTLGMNLVSLDAMSRLVEVLVRTVLTIAEIEKGALSTREAG
jgi:succinyl-diaminopimelate desuccinylase